MKSNILSDLEPYRYAYSIGRISDDEWSRIQLYAVGWSREEVDHLLMLVNRQICPCYVLPVESNSVPSQRELNGQSQNLSAQKFTKGF